MVKNPTMLIILDGWGIGPEYPGNAVKLAHTPNFDKLIEEYPNSTLDASGLAVGLPPGQMGNSEVGHLNIGAGRIIYQELPRISREIEIGDFYKNKEFLAAIENAKTNNSKVHLVGLLSDGGVHSHNTHLYGLLEMMKRNDCEQVYVHAILDGRDVAPQIGKQHMEELLAKMDEIGVGEVATVSGRFYSMDRDKRWERTELAYDAMTLGIGSQSRNPILAIEKSYSEGVTDEFMLPNVILNKDLQPTTVDTGDSIIFFNFRPDRARQLTRAFVDTDFEGFQREKVVSTFYVTMTEYDSTIAHVNVAYRSTPPMNTLSSFLSVKGMHQLKVAETEKYAHVTFFFNGGIEEPYLNEDRVLVPSPKVSTYDLQPEMSASAVKEQVLERLRMDKYELIVVNFANPDMVGHTAVIPAVIKAVETADVCLGEIIELLKEKHGKALITADHGNAEKLIDEVTGGPFTAHTTNKVPLILFGENNVTLREGKLADIAPTLLDMMGLEPPAEMTGESLIIHN